MALCAGSKVTQRGTSMFPSKMVFSPLLLRVIGSLQTWMATVSGNQRCLWDTSSRERMKVRATPPSQATKNRNRQPSSNQSSLKNDVTPGRWQMGLGPFLSENRALCYRKFRTHANLACAFHIMERYMISGQFSTVGIIVKRAIPQLAALKRLKRGEERSQDGGEEGRECFSYGSVFNYLSLKTPPLY